MHRPAVWILPLLAACASLSSITGARSVSLHHGYPVGHRIVHPSEEDLAIAVRATAELTFFDPPSRLQGGAGWVEAGEVTPVGILRITSDKPEVLEIVESLPHGVVLRGKTRGYATLSLETAKGPSELTVHVAEPARVELSHAAVDLPPEEARVFLAGGTARFHLVQRDSAGRVMGGWGALVPVQPDPPGSAAVELREGDIEHVDVALRRPGRLTLRPLGGAAVPVEVIELEGEATFGLDTLGGAPGQGPLEGLPRGEPQLVVLWVKDPEGRRLFGLVEASRLVSLTPEVCEVDRMERWYSEGVYQVRAAAVGECSLEASFRDASTTISVPVE